MACREHVPPEYIDKCIVSEKFDIFSLGILMVNIIAGPEGRSRSAEMSHQDFIDQVSKRTIPLHPKPWPSYPLE